MTQDTISHLPYRLNVGIMVINAQKQVFVGQRLDNPGKAWQMPQGGIDEGEDPQEAAFRELEEETGIPRDAVELKAVSADWITYDLPLDLIPQLWNGRYRGQKQKWYLFSYLGDDAQINIATHEPEFSHWKWLDSADLVENIVPFKRDVYVNVIDEFKEYL